MGNGYIRSFDDVYLVYPLLRNSFSGLAKGVYIALRKIDYKQPFIMTDPSYPHMCINYLCSSNTRNRMHMFQANELNYYKRRVQWVHAPVSEQRYREF